jgi:hypothetical protein
MLNTTTVDRTHWLPDLAERAIMVSMQMDKTLQRMRRKPGNMRAEKVSVEGRGLIKYI